MKKQDTPFWALVVSLVFGVALHWPAWLKLIDRKSTRLNSSHVAISYAVFCLKKKIEKILNIKNLYDKYHTKLIDCTTSVSRV